MIICPGLPRTESLLGHGTFSAKTGKVGSLTWLESGNVVHKLSGTGEKGESTD